MAGRRMQTEIPEFMHRVIGDGREEIQEGGREGGILYILLEISNPAGCGEEDVYTCTQRKEKTLPLVNFSQSAFFFYFFFIFFTRLLCPPSAAAARESSKDGSY